MISERENEMTVNTDVLHALEEYKIVAIVRGIRTENMISLADALYEGGIRLMEVTFDHKKKEGIDQTIAAIDILNRNRGDRMLIGAGTVLSAREVKQAYDAGAKYIITPNVNEEVIHTAHEFGMPIMCGAFTPTEIEFAYRCGADIVKVFPASLAGIEYIKAVKGPLGHIPMSAVGGVDVGNIADFYRAGATTFGIGGNLVSKSAIEHGDFNEIVETAREFVNVLTKAEI